MKKRIFALFIVVLSVFMIFGCSDNSNVENGEFEIPNYITIRGELISTEDYQLILFDRHLNNADIKPLKYMVNLTHLSLMDNQISDISPLAGLTNLSLLNLSGNQVSDLSTLAGLTGLAILNLSTNPISDLSSLAELVNLTHLDLQNTQIYDLSPLIGLTNLIALFLQNNPLISAEQIAELREALYNTEIFVFE